MDMGHLHGRKACEAVMRKGKVWKGRTVVIHCLPGHPRRPGGEPSPYAVLVGTFASAKLSKSAVVRNRGRRRVREAMRLTLKETPGKQPTQLLLCPRAASLDAPFDDLLAEARTFLSQLP